MTLKVCYREQAIRGQKKNPAIQSRAYSMKMEGMLENDMNSIESQNEPGVLTGPPATVGSKAPGIVSWITLFGGRG